MKDKCLRLLKLREDLKKAEQELLEAVTPWVKEFLKTAQDEDGNELKDCTVTWVHVYDNNDRVTIRLSGDILYKDEDSWGMCNEQLGIPFDDFDKDPSELGKLYKKEERETRDSRIRDHKLEQFNKLKEELGL